MENIEIQNIQITTERLQWELLSMKYIQEIFEEFTDEVTKRLRASTPKTIQEEEDRVKRSIEKHKQWTDVNFTVADEQGNFVWCCGIIDLKEKIIEVWLWIKQSERWKWYGKEMIGWLINWLQKNREFDYIKYLAYKENVWSRKIAESFGWELQVDDEGKEIIIDEWKFDKSSSFEAVEYRIHKK